MLKAMKYALYRETARTGGPLHGSNLTALLSFINLLADHFPVVSRGNNEVSFIYVLVVLYTFPRSIGNDSILKDEVSELFGSF